MTKKILLLTGLLIILTGCTVQVNVNISDGVIKEEVVIDSYPTSTITTDIIKNGFRKNVPAFKRDKLVDSEPDSPKTGVNYYRYSMNQLPNDGYRIIYSYDFNLSNYRESRLLNDAYPKKNVSSNANEYIIKGGSPNQYFSLYPDLDKVVINIFTNYEILDNNADSCDGNKCSWICTKNDNKAIYIKLNMANEIDKDSKNTKRGKIKIIIIIVLAAIVGLITLKIMTSKKANQ